MTLATSVAMTHLLQRPAPTLRRGPRCPYGVFRLPDGGLVRHHTMAWFAALFADFNVLDQVMFDAKTMNGNAARIVQWWLRAE